MTEGAAATKDEEAVASTTEAASASKEEASTTVSTSSTTLPIVLEAADAPASMCEHIMVGESTGTAGKGQSRCLATCINRSIDRTIDPLTFFRRTVHALWT